jgi:hypothetical protein
MRASILILIFVCIEAAGLTQPAPPAGQAALASAERVEIRGVIERVEIAPGAGTPFLAVKTDQGVERVQLGSMRYLMEQDFNPKAGAFVVVKGFRVNKDVIARRVELPGEKKVLELRAEDGTPLWRMGRYGKKGR